MSLETFFGSDKFNLFQTVIPFKGSSKSLLIYRIICFIILSYGLYGSIYVTIHHNPHETRDWIYFAYFTNQTYFGIMIYFLVYLFIYLFIFFFHFLFYKYILIINHMFIFI